jgi:hypothetical protein
MLQEEFDCGNSTSTAASSHGSNLFPAELGLGGSVAFKAGLPKAVKDPVFGSPGFGFLAGF